MRKLRSVAPLIGCLVWLGAGAAGAAERLGVLLPQTRPAAAPELRDRFHEAVVRGLGSGGDEVIPAGEVRLRLGVSDELLNCAGAGPCLARVAQALGTQRLVSTDIDISGKDYAIKLRLLDGTGRELTKVDEPCDICTVKEADEAVARAAAKLATAAHTLLGESLATTKPEATPPPKAEPPKPEPPKAEPPKPEPAPVVAPTPPPAETPPAHVEKKPFPWRAVAISSLVAGVVGLAVGIPLLAIDGKPTCNLPNPTQACPDVYNTGAGGGVMLGLGIGGLAASGVMFYMDHKVRTRRRPTVSLVPTQNGLYLSASGTY
jgi:hypothetical protein